MEIEGKVFAILIGMAGVIFAIAGFSGVL